MPFPMKIQPIDDFGDDERQAKSESAKRLAKSRFKRLFDRQFLKTVPAPGKAAAGDEPAEEFEPSSVCLAKMVQNFMEDASDKSVRCGRTRCNCFNGNCTDSSDEEPDSFNCFGEPVNLYSFSDACDLLKSLVGCVSVHERNLLADTAKLVDKAKTEKFEDRTCRKIVTDGLIALGYNASICSSRWEKCSSHPAGEYEYVDVITEEGRFIVDIDFRSEFEIARSTKGYKSILQVVPSIFVGKADRLEKIVSKVSEAAKQSLKKKGMPCPPWRKADYVKAKWLSLFTRTYPPESSKKAVTVSSEHESNGEKGIKVSGAIESNDGNGEKGIKFSSGIEPVGADGIGGDILIQKKPSSEVNGGKGDILIQKKSPLGEVQKSPLGEVKKSPLEGVKSITEENCLPVKTNCNGDVASDMTNNPSEDNNNKNPVVKQSEPLEIIRPRSLQKGGIKMVSGLASIIEA